MSTHKGNFQVLTLEEKKFMLPSPFRRKVESLDWKKIASTDIEKIVQTSNIEALEEFFGQITHCRPEIEFESSSDSGFLKVFKLCQLMIEYWHGCQQAIQDKYEKVVLKCTQLEEQNAALTLELQTLKDGLSAAKKELRRRKELLVSAQNEVVGDNRDEYDPCPYCSKRFLTTSYLMAHMQRRHQGLPFQPPFPTQNVYHGFAPKYPEKDYNPMQISPGQPSVSAQTILTVNTPTGINQEVQTDKLQPEVVSLPTAETITALIEKCLTEKSTLRKISDVESPNVQSVQIQVGEHDLIQYEDQAPPEINNKNSAENPNSGTSIAEEKPDTGESVKDIMAEIKHQLDLQWQYFSGNIQDNDLEELKSTLLLQTGETRTLRLIPSPMVSPAHFRGQNFSVVEVERAPGNLESSLPIKSPIHEHVEERFQQQQNELESLKKLLQTKMESDIKIIEGKLESQERYWRSKLRLLEEDYNYQLGKFRQEFQASLKNPSVETQTPQAAKILQEPVPDTQPEVYTQKPTEISVILPSKSSQQADIEHSLHEEPQRSLQTTHRPKTNQKLVTANEIKPENVFKPVIPVSPQRSKSPIVIIPKKLPVPKPRTISVTLESEPQPLPQQLIAVKSRHEYEEPEDVLKFDQVQEYSQSEEEDTTDDLSRNEIIDTEKHPEVGAQSNIPEERLHDPEELSGISKMQAHVTQEVNNQLQALGLDPNAPEISAQDMKRISKQFQARRESVQSRASNFEEQQQVVKPDFQSAAAAVQNNDRLDPRNTAATLEKASRSPLIKVLTAVRTSGMKMHKRVKSAITKTPKRRTSLTLSTLAKPSKESFFSRARWGRKKTPLNVNKEIPPEEKSLEKSSSSSEYTESDESSSESEQDVEVHYIPKEKLPNSKTSTPVKVEPGKIHEIEMSDSVSKPNGNPASRSLQKRKTSTRSQKASTLRNKEAISNKIVGKEKSKQKLELKQEPSFKKPVRRSLDAEFDQATPKKVVEHVSDSLSGDQSTGDEISSSWEEEEGNLDAGAYVHLTPQNNPGERQTRHDPSAIPSNTSEKPFRKDTLSNTGKSGKHQQQMNAAVGKPLTTRPRIALDSWDAVDDDEFQSKPSFENKPTLVSQRWNDEPLYPNTGGRRTPMSMVQTGESTDKSRNSTQQQRKGKHEGKNMRDSPLNNSWDSN